MNVDAKGPAKEDDFNNDLPADLNTIVNSLTPTPVKTTKASKKPK
jgi:hypothetical protein